MSVAELISENLNSGLTVKGLRKNYRRRVVIRDISMSVQRGEIVALLGPNGSGKTTSFYAIAGLVASDGGQVLLDGEDITRLPMYRRARMGIGYLPQETSVFRGLCVKTIFPQFWIFPNKTGINGENVLKNSWLILA